MPITNDQLLAFTMLFIIGRTLLRGGFYLFVWGFENPVEFFQFII